MGPLVSIRPNARSLTGLLCLLLILPATPVQAIAQEVSGTWQARWAQAVRTHADGSMEIQRWGDAQLVIEQHGSQLSGTWTINVQERVTWTFEGTLEEGRIRLSSTGHDSTNPELAIVDRMTWSGAMEAGELSGTVSMHFRGRERPPAARPFTAERSQAGGTPGGH